MVRSTGMLYWPALLACSTGLLFKHSIHALYFLHALYMHFTYTHTVQEAYRGANRSPRAGRIVQFGVTAADRRTTVGLNVVYSGTLVRDLRY
jgi:hypothetical protein